MTDPRIETLAGLLANRGARQYGLHDVTQCEHALQSAWLAERTGCDANLIAAALLHDIGHMVHDFGENPAADGIDDRHEDAGECYLAEWFGPEVTEPVRLHVAAKRYLCSVEPDYFARLSADSVLSLALQGGPMSAAESAAFIALPHADAATRLRRFDDAAKETDLRTPPAEHFLRYVAGCLRPQAAA